MLLMLACHIPPTAWELPDSDGDLIAAFSGLHEPIYDAYRIGQDADALHNLLAGRFSGQALTREYVEHFLALHRLKTQQTTIHIESVVYAAVEVIERAGATARVDADWSVRGTITHRGHAHTRTNRYAAVYTLTATSDGLRIIDTRLRDLERLAGRLSTGQRGGLTPLELLEQDALEPAP